MLLKTLPVHGIVILPTFIYLLGQKIWILDAFRLSFPLWITWQLCHIFYWVTYHKRERPVVRGPQRVEKTLHMVTTDTEAPKSIQLSDMISPNDPPDVASLIQFFYTMTELERLDLSGPIDLKPLDSKTNNNGSYYDPNQWRPIVNDNGMSIFEKTDQDMFFKVFAQVDTSSASAFDLFVDIHKRPLWDQLCAQGDVAAYLDHWTRLVYVRMRAIWPTTARDLLLKATIRNLGHERYLMISKSIEHPSYPPVGDCIRMHANCIGQLFLPLGKDRCQIIQLADTDMKGWIPKSVVGFVATKAIPRAFSKITDALLAEPLKTTSDTFLKIALDSSGMTSNPPSVVEEVPGGNEVSNLLHRMDARLSAIEQQMSHKKSGNKPGAIKIMHSIFQCAAPYLVTGVAVVQVYLIMCRGAGIK